MPTQSSKQLWKHSPKHSPNKSPNQSPKHSPNQSPRHLPQLKPNTSVTARNDFDRTVISLETAFASRSRDSIIMPDGTTLTTTTFTTTPTNPVQHSLGPCDNASLPIWWGNRAAASPTQRPTYGEGKHPKRGRSLWFMSFYSAIHAFQLYIFFLPCIHFI